MNKLSQFGFILYQLSRPLSYLRIKHEDKWIYDWIAPAFFTLITLSAFYFLIPITSLVASEGLISQLTDFIANLPGFFIAALAAVATFNKNDIDQLMANSPKIEILHHGSYLMVEMTRRRFLCVLFSYLTAVSIFLVIGARIGLASTVAEEYQVTLSWLGVGCFIFIMWQMILATILGLYYLGERLHTPT
ncbi:hypothetical protein [Neptuniibacter sp.]|uniref:hypothetical protein n=1 Tax=Neptuniibacter sp. TaxID=1962643 RepID=UPI003B593F50